MKLDLGDTQTSRPHCKVSIEKVTRVAKRRKETLWVRMMDLDNGETRTINHNKNLVIQELAPVMNHKGQIAIELVTNAR